MSDRFNVLLHSFFLIILLPYQSTAGHPTEGMGEYRVIIRAQDHTGQPVPATLTITAQKTNYFHQKSLQNDSHMVPLPSGDIYHIEATHGSYQTVYKDIDLIHIADITKVPQYITLEMQLAHVPVRIYVIDHQTGQPIAGGFFVQVDETRDNQPDKVPQLVNEPSITLQAAPQQPLRFTVKARGYISYPYEVTETRLSNDVTIRLRRQIGENRRAYNIRVMDGDYKHVLPHCEVQVTDEFKKNVPVFLDSYTGDWRVLLNEDETYAIEAKAQGFRTYYGTLSRPPQTLILIVLYRDIDFASEPDDNKAPHRQPTDSAQTPAESLVAEQSLPSDNQLVSITDKPEEFALSSSQPLSTLLKSTQPTILARLAEKLGRSDATLSGLSKGKTITLDQVFFDQGSYLLHPESYAQLELLAAQLDQKPTLRVEIGGHTDRVGDAKLNFLLSESRAKVVYNYLLNKGIAPDRLQYKGYGHTHLLAPSDTEENRKRNRRVEVRVMEE